MSSTEEVEIKAGHPPAMKVGGMRVAQRSRRDSEEAAQPKPRRDSEEDAEEEVTLKNAPRPPLIVSGVQSKIDRDFPTEAVKRTHDKPVPTHDTRSSGGKPNIIQQPRK